ncbi:hypothetical protein [Chryseobacterium viscerum]|jgi:hypothetical protein|uniref:Uncharacterized protein n=1 Tax=Chryseobacterium viscerum TaxID=1037377 RepID=A0A316WKA8_9FLAO|nr:hypothetical protein [Chryseobacterium viscerum]KAB1231611.1 hypothetical protein F8D52_07335 [Chryseobacterium viscerum]PWN60893.1 hypothetical protein C1634_012540 [Chryseobacterium viscerum]
MKKLNKHPKPKNRFGLRSKKNTSRKAYYSQFVSLFYIRNTNITLERDAKEILRMLRELQNLNNKSRLVFSTHCGLSKHNLWQSVLVDLHDNIQYIRFQFEYILANIIQKNKINSPLFWQQNKIYMNGLEGNHEKLIQMANQLLPEEERLSWKAAICNFYDEILSLLAPLTSICKLESDFIERYNPKIFNKITVDIIKDIPKDYTLKEAREYEQEYLKILTDYSHEFSKKSNLWESLLHILSGGMYQLPSERVMLKRWINGKMKEKFPK